MPFEALREPDFDTPESITLSATLSPRMIGVRLRSAAGGDGEITGGQPDPGDEGQGGRGSVAELVAEVSDSDDVEIWAGSGLEGYYNGGASSGNPGGGAAALVLNGTIIAICGGGGGGGDATADSSGTSGDGGGGGAPGGQGGDGDYDGSSGADGEDAESATASRWDVGGDGGAADATTGEDGGDGGVEIETTALLESNQTAGTVTATDPDSQVWLYEDAGAPSATATFRKPTTGVAITWDPHDCDEIIIYRDGAELATVAPEAREYVDDTAATDSSYDYTIAAMYCGHEEQTSSMTVDTSTVEISGTTERDDTPLDGATVAAINRDEDITEAEATADSNGEYTLEVRPGYEYHVIAEFDDGATMYNATSYPFLNP